MYLKQLSKKEAIYERLASALGTWLARKLFNTTAAGRSGLVVACLSDYTTLNQICI